MSLSIRKQLTIKIQEYTIKRLNYSTFYYYRPVNVFATHGYGPVLMAGGEMIKLLSTYFPKMNDSVVHYYEEEQKTDAPIFGIENPKERK